MSHIINVGREVIIFVGVNLYPSNSHVKLTFPLCIPENKTIPIFSPTHHSLNGYNNMKRSIQRVRSWEWRCGLEQPVNSCHSMIGFVCIEVA